MHSIFIRIATCHYRESNPEHKQITGTADRFSRHGDANMILMTYSVPKSFFYSETTPSVYTNLAAYKIDITTC